MPNRLLTVNLLPAEPFQPLIILLFLCVTQKERGGKIVWLLSSAYRFLSISMAKPTIIMMIIAVPKLMMYVPAIDGGGGVGVGEAWGASVTYVKVLADELPYELDPSKDTIILYSPGTSGVVHA